MMSIRLLQISYSNFTDVCKLFSCGSKPIHALLASKRRLIDLQKVLFNPSLTGKIIFHKFSGCFV